MEQKNIKQIKILSCFVQKHGLIFTKTRQGTSLIIAVGLITVIVLVSIGITSVVISSIRQSSNVNRANQAYYAAEGALEEGLLVNQESGAGYSGSPTAISYSGNSNLQATYHIQGQVSQNTQYSDGTYGIPTPGTGNAGIDCNSLKPVISGNFNYPADNPSASYSAQDHPCNWNKIKVGETVAIPLYVTTTSMTSICPPEDPNNPGPTKVCNPADLGLNLVRVRVRTPCQNGASMCAPIERYNLDLATGEASVDFNDTIMDWTIEASNRDNTKSYVLKPLRGYDDLICLDAGGILGRCEPILNSEIYESQINFKKSVDSTVLEISNLADAEGGQDIIAPSQDMGYILDFLINQFPWDVGGLLRPNINDAINKPILKLSLIRSLQEQATGNTIPYLEYQVITDSTTPILPTNVVQTITAEGFSGSFKQVLEVKTPQESGILEYVIQQ